LHASGRVVVVVGLYSVVVEVDVVVIVIVDVDVVVVSQGQSGAIEPPTTDERQVSASVAVVGSVPFGAHAHSGLQVSNPTATFRM
jgi:hypothetical protein